MRGLGIGLFLLWIIIHEGTCNYAEILWGQCHVFCLTRYQSRLQKKAGLKDVPLNPDSAFQDCRKDRQCKWCLFACQRPHKDFGDHKDCVTDCRNSRTKRNPLRRGACFDGCHFISKSYESKYGTCPPPAELSVIDKSCAQECQKDVTCVGMSKCCNTTCGQICHSPRNLNGFPSKPRNLRFKERKDGGLLVEWDKSLGIQSSAHIIYILRWWCPYTEGVRYSITTKLRARLSGYPGGVHPAIRCNYMVASINIHGSQGFTKPIGYLKKFLHPSPPLNLERTKRKLHDGKVDVTVRWQAPEFTDGLDVDRYVVFWSDGLPRAGNSYMRLQMNRKIVKMGKTNYTIPSLEPGIMYFVQVRAVVDWRGKSIRGQPASTYIESFTFPLPPEEDVGRLREEFLSNSRVYDIMVDEPVFVDSKLKARASWSLYSDSESAVEKYILYWTLDVCDGEAKHRKTPSRLIQEAETQKQEFDLFGLESGCVYELTIHTASFFGDRGEGQKQFFRTPPCLKTKGRTDKVVCQSKASPPSPPRAVEVTFQPTCACQAVVSWQRPDLSADMAAYSVRWGQSRKQDVSSLAVVYNAEPYSINVSGSHSQACMNLLRPGTHYTVQVYTHTNTSRSSPAVRHFTMPIGTMPCFSFKNVEDMQRDQSSPAATEISIVEEMKGKDLRRKTTTASVYPGSSAPSLHKAASVFVQSMIISLSCAAVYQRLLLV
ncbi:hypothetical protein RRG08_049922 [Elysia crispata]|uniref:Anosmin-1 n=1 Tax=Elysia crispata TaxID=231223 RepID=A0AAE0Y0A0_9GAST|nr:hypothetical protein RRG08_049922 [Elysia crispata]